MRVNKTVGQIFAMAEMLGIIRPGLYRHYKGGLYKVIGIARHTETLEHYVVYQTCPPKEDLWVRPASMFAESITHPTTGTVVPRFSREEEIKDNSVYFRFL